MPAFPMPPVTGHSIPGAYGLATAVLDNGHTYMIVDGMYDDGFSVLDFSLLVGACGSDGIMNAVVGADYSSCYDGTVL